MKCTVLFGSPNKHGHTVRLLSKFLKENNIENYEIISAYNVQISPCTGCGACMSGACVKRDFFIIKDIYNRIASSDIFILASPVYFNSVPSPLKCIIDRMQPYYIEKFVLGKRSKKKPQGILLMCGGETEREDVKKMLKMQLKYAFDVFGFEISDFIYEGNTDSH